MNRNWKEIDEDRYKHKMSYNELMKLHKVTMFELQARYSGRVVKRGCANCGKLISEPSVQRLYCSGSCKTKSYRKRKAHARNRV